mmetsp:Transcript_11490/g.10156  ORF Transcript_11490/g.10156 Transcript_11490/m.10156 type:complete len:289 (-) Transcript_11490:31-897(-)
MYSFFSKKESKPKKDIKYKDTIQEYNGVKIIHRIADITKEETDCIVNAANGNLAHGGGVAYAIAKAGGLEVSKDSRDWIKEHGKIDTGKTGYTRKGNLGCKNYVVHTVGPIWRNGNENEDELLRDAVRNALIRASELKQKSISVPAISSGIFGYPLKRACIMIAKGTKEYLDNLEEYNNTLDTIVMCNIIKKTHDEVLIQCQDVIVQDTEENKEETEEKKEEVVAEEEESASVGEEMKEESAPVDEGKDKESASVEEEEESSNKTPVDTNSIEDKVGGLQLEDEQGQN